jgi:hypothetical protein
MATTVGSLAAGLDGHVVKLGFALKVLRKTWKTLTIFLVALTLPL